MISNRNILIASAAFVVSTCTLTVAHAGQSTSADSGSQKLDQNAQLGKGHLGPNDPATKAGVSEEEHRANASGHGQNNPHTLRGGSGRPVPSGDTQKDTESDSRGQDATNQGVR
jgi:hypothetical protein